MAQVRNPHTRRNYMRAAIEFFDWLNAREVRQLTKIERAHVAAYIEELACKRSTRTATLHLAALRNLFDWMVVGEIIPANPAATVRNPRYIARRRRMPPLDPVGTHQFIAEIDTTHVVGMRDRGFVGFMLRSFACIGAAARTCVDNVCRQDRRVQARPNEPSGKQDAAPAPCNLEFYLRAYAAGARWK